jgi:hypothetical protein
VLGLYDLESQEWFLIEEEKLLDYTLQRRGSPE